MLPKPDNHYILLKMNLILALIDYLIFKCSEVPLFNTNLKISRWNISAEKLCHWNNKLTLRLIKNF